MQTTQDEVPLTLTKLRNDPEQMASIKRMNDSFFRWPSRITQDSHNPNTVPLEQQGTN